MPWSDFNWDPVTGVNDTTQFPRKDSLFRQHLQTLLDQVKSFFNSTVKTELSLKPNQSTSNITYYVDAAGNDNNNGLAPGASNAFKTIAKAISMIPQALNHIYTINVASGTYNEAVKIEGFIGKGAIYLYGGSDLASSVNYVLGDTITITKCMATVVVRGFKILSTLAGNEATVVIDACIKVMLKYCTVDGSNRASAAGSLGVSGAYSKIHIDSTNFINCYGSSYGYAVYGSVNADIMCFNTGGSGNRIAFVSQQNSRIGIYGTTPSATSPESQSSSGKIIKDINSTNFAANGYRYNDDGSIEQWGTFDKSGMTAGTWASQQVVFPIAFPNQLLDVKITYDSFNTYGQANKTTESLTGFWAFMKTEASGTARVSWRAFGR